MREEITQVATSLLNFPSSVGHRVSTKKAPLACQSVIYAGFTIPRGYQSLGVRARRPYVKYHLTKVKMGNASFLRFGRML